MTTARVCARSLALGSGSMAVAAALQSPRPLSATQAEARQQQPPCFSIGIIADVQWADMEDGSNYDKTVIRHYRAAFRTLQRAVDWWDTLSARPLSFVAQLGDLIDGVNAGRGQSDTALAAALAELARAPSPVVNIVGNHELYNFDRPQLARADWYAHLPGLS